MTQVSPTLAPQPRCSLGPSAQQLATTSPGVSPQPQSGEPGDLKPLRFKDTPDSAKYGGSIQGWLSRFMVARDPRWEPLLEAIELLHGDAVTAQNEADWEQRLKLKPSIAAFKDLLKTQLGKFASGSAALTISQCGIPNACEAWRIFANAGCPGRPDATMSYFAKVKQPKKKVPDKDLQGYLIEWERDLAFYFKMTNKRAIDDDQHKMHLMNMRSVALQTHFFYREPIHQSEMGGIRCEIDDYLNRAADDAAAWGKE